MTDKFKFALNKYLAAIKEDYIQWGKPEAHLTASERSVRAMSRERFCKSLLYQEGKKYIKVVSAELMSRIVVAGNFYEKVIVAWNYFDISFDFFSI